MDVGGAYESADHKYGSPHKSLLLKGFNFKTLREILDPLRPTPVSTLFTTDLFGPSCIITFHSKTRILLVFSITATNKKHFHTQVIYLFSITTIRSKASVAKYSS